MNSNRHRVEFTAPVGEFPEAAAGYTLNGSAQTRETF